MPGTVEDQNVENPGSTGWSIGQLLICLLESPGLGPFPSNLFGESVKNERQTSFTG